MLLAMDCGNTNIVFAACAGEKILRQWRYATVPNRTADEYATQLKLWFAEAGWSLADFSGAILSSVVPDATANIQRFAQQHLGFSALTIGEAGVDVGVVVDITTPREVGADRLVNARAVIDNYTLPALVIDFGTATTFDVIDSSGVYIGGVIAPGVNLSLEALHRAAAKLPRVDILPPQKAIGKTTMEAMQSGIYWGYVGLIEGLIARIEDEAKFPLTVVATGGLARLYADGVPRIQYVDDTLIIKGLQKIWGLNRKGVAA